MTWSYSSALYRRAPRRVHFSSHSGYNKLEPQPLISHKTFGPQSRQHASGPDERAHGARTWRGHVPYKRHPTYMCQTWFLTAAGAQLYGRISRCGLCGRGSRFELFIRPVLAARTAKPIFWLCWSNGFYWRRAFRFVFMRNVCRAVGRERGWLICFI